MDVSTAAQDDGILSAFLDNFPTPLHYIQPESRNQPWVFWSQGSEINSSSSANVHPPMLQDHIKSVFSNLESFFGGVILQLWAPSTVTIGGRRLLSTSNQPFAVNNLGDGFKKYRVRCMEYRYNIDVNNHRLHFHEDENPMILSGGPAAAFLNRMPELANLERDHRGSPLPRLALEECGLWFSVMVPICYLSQASSCIAVVECTFDDSTYLKIITRMKSLLEEAGLSICLIQERIPYKNINALKPACGDIEAALKIICESHNVDVAQVWIAYEDENHEPFSSSLENTQTKRVIALKLTGYLHEDFSSLKDTGGDDYYDICDVFHREPGEELVGKTLQDYKPRFSSRIDEPALFAYTLFDETRASSVAICLRSTDTGDLDYAFEFIWGHYSNYVIFLEALLLTLKKCLPSFKLASGAELGDELYVIDVYYLTDLEIESFKIFQGKKSSPVPIALEARKKSMVVDSCKAKWKTAPKELSKEDIEKQFGNTMKEAAENLNVSLSTLKRKCKGFDIYEWQGRSNVVKGKINAPSTNQSNRSEEDNGTIQEPSVVNRNENTLTIKAVYADDMIKFDLHTSQASFVTVEKEIGKKLNLSPGTYKLKYLDKDGDLILLTSDQDMHDCITYFINLGQRVVRLRVFPSPHKPSSYEICFS